ncbi:MAG: hypothetical protein Q7U53_04925 [Anaerolineaceae bacterium]|nr:hypothetical protein [Anaerolineaceae bacterium]
MKFAKRIIVPILFGFFTTWIFAFFSSYEFIDVFWGTWFFTSISYILLFNLFLWLGSNKFLGVVVGIALFLRLGLGLITTENLIDWGYDQEPYLSGYLFRDAYNRDMQSWELAISDQPIWKAFSSDFISDQYGGLLASSAIIYRLFTPNSHLQINVIFFVALINVLGILFLGAGLREKYGDNKSHLLSKIIIIIFAFYPDAILFGASQMREPLLMGFSAGLFWIIHKLNYKIGARIAVFSFFSFLLLLVSLKIGVFLVFTFLIWLIFQPDLLPFRFIKSKLLTISIISMVLITAYFSYNWIMEAGEWDAIILEQKSGFVQYIVSIIGTKYRLHFATVYGLFQPVLPAALVEPSKLFWRILQSLRAAGWYIIFPGLIYGLVYYFREKDKETRKQFLVLWLMTIFWIFLSSIRAGGDMWDNPRYRLSFLVIISYIVGTSFFEGWKRKDHWLIRIFVAELIFILFFLQWYIARYTGLFENLSFFNMVYVLSLLFGIILITGIIREFKNYRIKKRSP